MSRSELPMWDITMSDKVKCGETFARFETKEDAERWARRAWGHHFGPDVLVVAKEVTCSTDGDDAASVGRDGAPASSGQPDSGSAATAPSTTDTSKSVKP